MFLTNDKWLASEKSIYQMNYLYLISFFDRCLPMLLHAYWEKYISRIRTRKLIVKDDFNQSKHILQFIFALLTS